MAAALARWILVAGLLLPMGCDESPANDDDVVGDAGPAAQARVHFVEVPLDGGWSVVTGFEFLPDDTFVMFTKEGRIGHLQFLKDGSTLLLGEFWLEGVETDEDGGLISVAVDPFFEDTGYLFAGYCTSLQGSTIVRLTFSTDDYSAVLDSAVNVLTVVRAAASRNIHNVGSLGFDDDAAGTLWALFGEKFSPGAAADLENNLGALVRVVPNRDPGGSGAVAAPDNPWPDSPDISPELYASGLRSPWTGFRDRLGRYWVGDVGSNEAEEINLITEPGANLGWPACEGPCGGSADDAVDPILWWGRGVHPYAVEDADLVPVPGRIPWVGTEYVPEAGADRYDGLLTNKVLFGDYRVGFVRAAEVDASGLLLSDEHVAHLTSTSAWRQGPDGYLYVATFGDGQEEYPDPQGPTTSRLWRVELGP